MIIKDIEICNFKPTICVPAFGQDQDAIISSVNQALSSGTKMIEWRIDYFENVLDFEEFDKVASQVRDLCKDVILLVTFRSGVEGGEQFITSHKMKELVTHIVENQFADMVDLEYDMFKELRSIISKKNDLSDLINTCHQNDVAVVLSHHNFEETPSTHLIKNKLARMYKTQADIVKMALMPNKSDDVDRLQNVTRDFANSFQKTIITMSMGQLGRRSRTQGSIYGSAVTFASVSEASAPGQIPYDELLEIINRNIYLVGFMGCGKTTMAKAFAKRYGMNIVDMDDEIVKKCGKSIPEIFNEQGEDEFRKIESQVLEDISKEHNTVVSCGGGACLSEYNRNLMKSSGKVVLLTADAQVILNRVKNDENRPLLKGKKNVKDIQELIDARQPNYEKAADFSVDSSMNLEDSLLSIINRVYN